MKLLSFSIFIPVLLFISCDSKDRSDGNDILPNIIIIHVDDLGYTDLGCFGSDFYETPNIDKLAASGIKFTNSYAAAAVCSPTRAALLTGKYPARFGLTDWIRSKFQGGIIQADGKNPSGFDVHEGKPLMTPKNPLFLDLSEKILAEHLKEKGYYSVHIGKWHLGQSDHLPELRGFDENYGGCDLGQPPSYFDPYEPPNNNPDYKLHNLPPRKEGEYLTDREGDEVVEFLKRNKDKRFFLHWAPYAVHTPLQAKEDLIEKYQAKESGLQNNAVYAAMIESLDENIGKLTSILENLHLTNNTLVIFTSDNGGLIGNPNNVVTNNAPLRSGKGYPYEGGIKIPTIIKWPDKIEGGLVDNTPIITMDIAATILDIANVDFESDGVSLLPLVTKNSALDERSLFWHFPHYRQNDVVPYTIVRKGDFKLIKYYDDTKWELYNLKSDPGEKINLIDSNPETTSTLNTSIIQWIEQIDALTPVLKQ
ncbi:MAG: sulfatase [Cyclobacteriaceae bacterium]|nr:sulfatase [Cyclobacteriaceae bacterium]